MAIMVTMLKGQSIVPVKPLTNIESSQWRWDPKRSTWLQWSEIAKSWVANHKPLPQWFIEADGTIPASVFLRLWNQASSWSDLHQHLFWLSLPELQLLAEQLAFECRRCGVESPEMLSSDVIQTTIPVSEWLEEGLVSRIEGAEISTHASEHMTTYDPMQALFEAQKKRNEQGLSESRPFFQTVEQGKFTAKH